MQNGPEAFQPVDGHSGVQLRTQWAALHGSTCTLRPPEYEVVSPDSLETIPAAQRDLSRQGAQRR
jgi:hypothetical protein